MRTRRFLVAIVAGVWLFFCFSIDSFAEDREFERWYALSFDDRFKEVQRLKGERKWNRLYRFSQDLSGDLERAEDRFYHDWIMALYLRDAGANLARAHFLLNRAHQELENPSELVLKEFLREKILVAGELGLYEQQRLLLESYSKEQDAQLDFLLGVTYLHLEDFEESKNQILRLDAGADEGTLPYLTTLKGLLAFVEDRIEESARFYLDALGQYRATEPSGEIDVTFWVNASQGLVWDMEWKHARMLLQEAMAIKERRAGAYAMPERLALELALMSGQWSRAWGYLPRFQTSLSRLGRVGRRQRLQKSSETLASLALFLGFSERSLEILEQSEKSPDRRGVVLNDPQADQLSLLGLKALAHLDQARLHHDLYLMRESFLSWEGLQRAAYHQGMFLHTKWQIRQILGGNPQLLRAYGASASNRPWLTYWLSLQDSGEWSWSNFLSCYQESSRVRSKWQDLRESFSTLLDEEIPVVFFLWSQGEGMKDAFLFLRFPQYYRWMGRPLALAQVFVEGKEDLSLYKKLIASQSFQASEQGAQLELFLEEETCRMELRFTDGERQGYRWERSQEKVNWGEAVMRHLFYPPGSWQSDPKGELWFVTRDYEKGERRRKNWSLLR